MNAQYMVAEPRPAQMNMKIQLVFLYSGLPSPRRMLPYLLMPRPITSTTQAKPSTWTSTPKVVVARVKS